MKQMKKWCMLMLIAMLLPVYANAQDIIVKKDGTILNVFNLEESSNSYFYTLDSSKNSGIQKISKDDVFSVKKNGSTQSQLNVTTENTGSRQKHPNVTAVFASIIKNKRHNNCFTAKTPDGKELNYAVLSESNKTVTVIKGEYHESSYIIPEFIKNGNEIYTVTEIDEGAFSKEGTINDIQFPNTLKKIGKGAFTNCMLEKIVLPDGIEELCDWAFSFCGRNPNVFSVVNKACTIQEIYLPSSLKKIGKDCFRACGRDTSPREYCQAYFSNMPEFITEGNCQSFGIDDEAVSSFRNSKK